MALPYHQSSAFNKWNKWLNDQSILLAAGPVQWTNQMWASNQNVSTMSWSSLTCNRQEPFIRVSLSLHPVPLTLPGHPPSCCNVFIVAYSFHTVSVINIGLLLGQHCEYSVCKSEKKKEKKHLMDFLPQNLVRDSLINSV